YGRQIDQEQAQVQGAQAQGHVEGTRRRYLERGQESQPQRRQAWRPQEQEAQARLGRADFELVRIEREQPPDGGCFVVRRLVAPHRVLRTFRQRVVRRIAFERAMRLV